MTEESYTHLFNGRFEFKEIGRNKANFIVDLKHERDFWKALKPHLMSNDIHYVYDGAIHEGEIFVGGFRKVGTFKRIGDR